MINQLTLLPNQCWVCIQVAAVLTVQVTLSDSLHILSMNELVAPLPDNVHRRQVHVVANPDRINSDSLNVYPLKRLLKNLTSAPFAGSWVKLNKYQLGLVKVIYLLIFILFAGFLVVNDEHQNHLSVFKLHNLLQQE